MPPRGVKKGSKRARQYEHVKQSRARPRCQTNDRAEEIAARTVNKERARSGEDARGARGLSTGRTSRQGAAAASGRERGRQKRRTYEQLYNEAKDANIEGRSKMNKAQLERALARH